MSKQTKLKTIYSNHYISTQEKLTGNCQLRQGDQFSPICGKRSDRLVRIDPKGQDGSWFNLEVCNECHGGGW